MSVRKFFEIILHDQIVKQTSAAAGVGTATVVRIWKEYEGNSGLLSSPEKRYTASRVQIVLDDFNVEAIRKEVHAFYGRKEYPTLDSLLGVLKNKNLFQGRRTTLWKVLREMGFRHKKYQNKQYIYEQLGVIQQRAKSTTCRTCISRCEFLEV